MVSKEIVIETIKKMNDSGIDEDSIRSTLKGIGLDDDEIDSYLDEVLGEVSEESTEEEAPENESIAEKTASKIRPEINKLKEEQGLYSTHAQIAMEDHSRKLGEMHSKLNELHKKTPFSNSDELTGKINALEKRLQEIDRNTTETKAAVNALQNLMQKILSNERDIMLELQKKKQ
ncbi:MAG: hypothetical protein ABIA76_05210 [Candidatus Diapherotrites archaeon]